MATPIKETPILSGKEGQKFLEALVSKPKKVTKEELKERKKNYNFLESISKF